MLKSLLVVTALITFPALASAQSDTAAADSSPLKLRLGPPGARPGHDSVAIEPVTRLDKPPELLSLPTPQTSASHTGVGGVVRLQFVVDSTGKVEPATVEVITSSNQSFNGPAIDALLLSRWRPAELNHHRVRAAVATSIPIKG